MNKIITVFAPSTLLAIAALAQTSSSPTAAQDLSNVENFFRVNEQFCTGGQPSMDDLRKMKDQGVRSVLNLRRASEYNFEEEAATAKKLDLRYFHIPVDKNDLKDGQVTQFLEVTGDPQNRPLFIHCSTANRVGAFWMIRRALVDNWKVGDAEAEARKVGMHEEKLRDWALDYIKRHQKKEVPGSREPFGGES